MHASLCALGTSQVDLHVMNEIFGTWVTNKNVILCTLTCSLALAEPQIPRHVISMNGAELETEQQCVRLCVHCVNVRLILIWCVKSLEDG